MRFFFSVACATCAACLLPPVSMPETADPRSVVHTFIAFAATDNPTNIRFLLARVTTGDATSFGELRVVTHTGRTEVLIPDLAAVGVDPAAPDLRMAIRSSRLAGLVQALGFSWPQEHSGMSVRHADASISVIGNSITMECAGEVIPLATLPRRPRKSDHVTWLYGDEKSQLAVEVRYFGKVSSQGIVSLALAACEGPPSSRNPM